MKLTVFYNGQFWVVFGSGEPGDSEAQQFVLTDLLRRLDQTQTTVGAADQPQAHGPASSQGSVPDLGLDQGPGSGGAAYHLSLFPYDRGCGTSGNYARSFIGPTCLRTEY